MVLVDAHTHLTESPMIDDMDQALGDFMDVGGVALVAQSMSDETFEVNCGIVDHVEDEDMDCIVKTTRGWHPSYVIDGALTEQQADQIEEQGSRMIELHEDKIVAVGECGVDLHSPKSRQTLTLQQQVLYAHCRLAMAYDLPVVVHSRDAFVETMDVVADFPDVVIYMHCRGYGPDELDDFFRFCPRGYVGFCGNITYPKADTLRESLLSAPRDRIVLETDAPYLSPQAVRGQKNTPAHIAHTYEYVANLLGISGDDCSVMMVKNFYRLYGL